MTDREFWLAIRAALKAMVAAIERKYLAPQEKELHIVNPSSESVAGVINKSSV